MWKKRQPELFSDFEISLSFFQFKLMLTMGLLQMAFIMLSYVPCIPNLSKTFIMKRFWILSEAFSTSNQIIVYFFCASVPLYGKLHLLICAGWSIPPSLGWKLLDHSRWSFFVCSWIWLYSILLRICASMFVRKLGP